MYESAVTVDSKNYWLLGNNFMRGFYSIFDADNKKFSFEPLAGTSGTLPGGSAEYGGVPTTAMATNVASPYAKVDNKNDNKKKNKGGGFPWWGYMIIGIGSAVVIVVVVVVILECSGDSEEETDSVEDGASDEDVPKTKKKTPTKPKTKPTKKPVEEEPLNEGDEDFNWNEGADPNAPKEDDGSTAVDSFMIKHIRNLISKKQNKQKVKNGV
jgi:cytoskeletal protein RodZ